MSRGVSVLDEAVLQNRLWTPSQLKASNSLALQLDASDMSSVSANPGVTAWRDKSGYNRNFTQSTALNQPTYNGSAIVFNGSQFLANSTLLSTYVPTLNVGVYYVGKTDSTGDTPFWSNSISTTEFIGGYVTPLQATTTAWGLGTTIGFPVQTSPVAVKNSGKPATGGYNSIFNNFTVKYNSTVTDLHWWGTNIADLTKFGLAYTTSVGGAAILINQIGTPTKTLTSLTTANNAPIYYYSVSVQPFALQKNTTYYLNIANVNFSTANTGWDWAFSNPNSGTHWMSNGLVITTGTLAFELIGYTTQAVQSNYFGDVAIFENSIVNNSMNVRINGGSVTTSPIDLVSTAGQGLFKLGTNYNNSQYLTGQIAQFVVAPTLSEIDRQRLEGHFAWAFAAKSKLPPTHPYTNTPPLI